jgi:hypothetical protein
VDADELAALSAAAAEQKLGGIQVARESTPPLPDLEPADPTMPAAGSPIRADAAAKAGATPLQARPRHLPIPLIVFAIVLVVLALATYLSGQRNGKPAGAPALRATATATSG